MKHLVAVAFGLLAFPAFAGWQRLGTTPGDEVVVYVDPSSIRKSGDVRRSVDLQDMKKPDAGGVSSLRSEMEYNCRSGQARLVRLDAFFGRMATGGKHPQSGPQHLPWSTPDSGSVMGAVMRYVCSH